MIVYLKHQDLHLDVRQLCLTTPSLDRLVSQIPSVDGLV